MTTATPYQLLGGEAGVRALCERFYTIMDALPEASDIRAMHGASLAPVQDRLFLYLSGWLGGPMLYLEKHGTICLTAPHAPFAIGTAERDQWLLCMRLALEQLDTPQDVREMLREPLFRVADMLVNRA